MEWLFPAEISSLTASILIAASFLTSALTAAVGLGGGVALIALMANLMPISALVPVHGVVQLGSNAGRAIVQFRHVDWTILMWFTLGAVAGAALGGSIAVTLPGPVLRLGIALFVLWIIWGKVPKFHEAPKRVMAATGFAATALSMFFGAAGPIGGAVLQRLASAVTGSSPHRRSPPLSCMHSRSWFSGSSASPRAMARADHRDGRQRNPGHACR